MFEVATGTASRPAETGTRRQATVRSAFDSLLQIRQLTNTDVDDPLSVPAQWERTQMVRAIALSLEADDIPPSAVDADGMRTATGYCVTASSPGTVRVEWLGPPGSGAHYQSATQLSACAAVLRRLGWIALEYRGPRQHRYLDVEPPS